MIPGLSPIPTGLSANSLLRGLLGSGNATTAAAAPRTGETSFASLLAKAREGQVASNLPVTLAPDANTKLSQGQLSRLAAAADVAQAHGASKALVSLDGRMLTLDVATREVTADVTQQLALAGQTGAPAALADIEAFVQVPSTGSSAAPSSSLAPSTSAAAFVPPATQSASLLAMLAQHDRA